MSALHWVFGTWQILPLLQYTVTEGSTLLIHSLSYSNLGITVQAVRSDIEDPLNKHTHQETRTFPSLSEAIAWAGQEDGGRWISSSSLVLQSSTFIITLHLVEGQWYILPTKIDAKTKTHRHPTEMEGPMALNDAMARAEAILASGDDYPLCPCIGVGT